MRLPSVPAEPDAILVGAHQVADFERAGWRVCTLLRPAPKGREGDCAMQRPKPAMAHGQYHEVATAIGERN